MEIVSTKKGNKKISDGQTTHKKKVTVAERNKALIRDSKMIQPLDIDIISEERIGDDDEIDHIQERNIDK